MHASLKCNLIEQHISNEVVDLWASVRSNKVLGVALVTSEDKRDEALGWQG